MKVVIVGAGSVGSSIARELLAHKHEILLIDLKPEVIGRSGLRGAHWLVGDACELSTLQGAKMEDADVVVSATGDDKVNLVVSLLAKTEFGVGRTVGRVNNPKNDWMFNDSWGVDVAVNTPQLMTALVEEAVEIGDLVRLLTLQTGVSSIVEFTVPHDSHVIGLTVGEHPLARRLHAGGHPAGPCPHHAQPGRRDRRRRRTVFRHHHRGRRRTARPAVPRISRRAADSDHAPEGVQPVEAQAPEDDGFDG